MSGKKQFIVPASSASLNSARPEAELNAVAGGTGSFRRWKDCIYGGIARRGVRVGAKCGAETIDSAGGRMDVWGMAGGRGGGGGGGSCGGGGFY